MPKGHYIPELLTIQTFSTSSTEMLAYCTKHLDAISEALGTLASGQAPGPVLPKLDGNSDDVTRAVAFGSVVHEYVHHLQCTTRMLGCLFFECRHQQSVWTHHCMAALRDAGAAPSIPLLRYANPSIPHSHEIDRWMDEWLPYEATILMTGFGSPSEAERRYHEKGSGRLIRHFY